MNLEKYKMIKIIESIDNYQTRQILSIYLYCCCMDITASSNTFDTVGSKKVHSLAGWRATQASHSHLCHICERPKNRSGQYTSVKSV